MGSGIEGEEEEEEEGMPRGESRAPPAQSEPPVASQEEEAVRLVGVAAGDDGGLPVRYAVPGMVSESSEPDEQQQPAVSSAALFGLY